MKHGKCKHSFLISQKNQDGNSSNAPAAKLPILPPSYLYQVRIDQTSWDPSTPGSELSKLAPRWCSNQNNKSNGLPVTSK